MNHQSYGVKFFKKKIVSWVVVDIEEFRIFLHSHLEWFFNFYNFCIFSSVYFLIYSSLYTFILLPSEFHFPREQDSSLCLHHEWNCPLKVAYTQSLFSVCPINWYWTFLPVGYSIILFYYSIVLWIFFSIIISLKLGKCIPRVLHAKGISVF